MIVLTFPLWRSLPASIWMLIIYDIILHDIILLGQLITIENWSIILTLFKSLGRLTTWIIFIIKRSWLWWYNEIVPLRLLRVEYRSLVKFSSMCSFTLFFFMMLFIHICNYLTPSRWLRTLLCLRLHIFIWLLLIVMLNTQWIYICLKLKCLLCCWSLCLTLRLILI